MAFNVDTLIYESTETLSMFNKATNALYWTIDDIKDPSLKTSADSTVKTDAEGTPVMTFYKAKTAQLTGSTSFFSLGFSAAQYGGAVTVGATGSEIVCPYTETITVGETATVKNTTITLTKTPYGTTGSEVTHIYALNANKSIGKSYEVATEASATKFSISGKTITLPTDADITATTRILVFYNYQTADAVTLENNATDMPKSGIVRMQCVFCNPCNKEEKYFLWVVSNNAQLSPESEINFSIEGEYSFTIDFQKEFCSEEGNLFTIIVPAE